MSIEVKEITKTFSGFKALDNVSLKVEAGELMALLGPSGSGKTTLLRIIAGLEVADAGEILFHGEDAKTKRTKDRNVGFVFQHYALFRHMTVFENVAFGLKVKPKAIRPNEKQIKEKVDELLKLVQLEWVASRYPSQLSGGQRQRIGLARALAIKPQLLLLDEPLSNIDQVTKAEVASELKVLFNKLDIPIILVTHSHEDALFLAEKLVVLIEGRIEQVGTVDEIIKNPKTPFIKRLLRPFSENGR